jgi:hypothetical protein
VYIPKWLLVLPIAALAAMAWKEYPALTRYLKIVRM